MKSPLLEIPIGQLVCQGMGCAFFHCENGWNSHNFLDSHIHVCACVLFGVGRVTQVELQHVKMWFFIFEMGAMKGGPGAYQKFTVSSRHCCLGGHDCGCAFWKRCLGLGKARQRCVSEQLVWVIRIPNSMTGDKPKRKLNAD